MIVNFSVKNFGPIKEKQTLSFEAGRSTHLEDAYVYRIGKMRLLKIALIYGANASGKSTILKALDFLRDIVLYPESKKTESFAFQPFLFDTNTSEENSVISIDFLQNGTRYFYEVELMKKAIVREELYFWKPNKASCTKDLPTLLISLQRSSSEVPSGLITHSKKRWKQIRCGTIPYWADT